MRWLSLLVALLVALPLEARWDAISHPTFLHPLPAAGPVDGPVRAIAQDGKGFIWFVGGGRLWRWDAHALQPAQLPASIKESEQPEVVTIAADRAGDIWVGTKAGLFRVEAGTLGLVASPVAQAARLDVQHIAIHQEGAAPVLFLAGDRTLHRLEVGALRLEAIPMPADARLHALLVDHEARLWIGTGSGLHSMPAGAATAPERVAGGLATPRISALHQAADRSLWIGTVFEGVWRRDAKGDFGRIALGNGAQPWVFTIAEAYPGALWVGTFGHGVYELDAAGAVRRHHRQNRLLSSSLPDDRVWKLLRDRQGLVWVGTGKTLSVLDARDSGVAEIQGGIGERGLTHDTVYSLLAVGDALWVGNAGGIDTLDPARGRTGRIAFSGPSLGGETDPVEALHADAERGIVASTSFATWSIEGESATAFTTPGRAPREFTNSFARFDGAFWMGGVEGLWRVPPAPAAPENLLAGQAIRRVPALLPGKDALWIGTWTGLMRLRPGGMPERVPHPVLDGQFVTSLRHDPAGRLWIGTAGAGLFILDAQGAWTVVGEGQGLPSRIVADVRFDPRGRAWVSGARGIARIDPQTLQVTPVVRGHEAVAAPYKRDTGAVLASGEVAFGGRGVTIIDTLREPEADAPAPLALTQLEGGARDVSFEFATLDYLRAAGVAYRYRLRGLDDEWRRVDSRHRVARFTNLPPGDYTFEAQYSRDGRRWMTPALEREIHIPAAWHERLPVRVAGLLLLAALLYMVHRVRMRVLHERARRLERAVGERTADLATANARLAVQARTLEEASLTDSLTGLRNRRFLDQHIEADVALVQRRRRENPDAADGDLIVVLIDIDHFKQINDRHGHAAGDAVLVEMARRLRPLFRETDYLMRWGGEEFLVLVRFTTRARCEEIARRVGQAVAGEPFEVAPGEHAHVTCSTGIAVYPPSAAYPEAHSWRDTLAFADEALYEAKRSGRDTWVIRSAAMSPVM